MLDIFKRPTEFTSISEVPIIDLSSSFQALLDHAPLDAVYIYFDTATFDKIERDQKVTFSSIYIQQCEKWSLYWIEVEQETGMFNNLKVNSPMR